jgi:hypothetical protein
VTAPSISLTLVWQTSVISTGGSNWLEAAPLTGSGCGMLAVTVNATGLVSDTYHGIVTVFDPANLLDQASANVTLHVVEPPPPTAPALYLSPDVVTFTAVLSETSPGSQQLAVWIEPISPTLTWATAVTTTGGLSWLSIAPPGGSGDDVVTVTVDSTNLMTGTYHGAASVFESAQPANRATADVVLIVEPAPPVLDKRTWLPLIMQ